MKGENTVGIEKKLNVASAANEEAMSGHNAFEEAGAAAIGGWDGDQPTAPTEDEIAACEGVCGPNR